MSISSSSSRARLAGGYRPDIAPALRFPTGREVGEGPYLERPQKTRKVRMTEFAGRTAVIAGGGGMGNAGAGLIHSRTSTGITDLTGDVVRHIYALTSDAQDLAIVAVALSRYQTKSNS